MGTDPVAEVLAEWLDARDRGERIEPEQVIRAHPALADQLRARFVAMDMVDQAFAETRLGEGRIPDRIGEYRILREVGRGGMGVVYEAEQTSMRRNVALKVLFPSVMSTPQAVQRFQREAWAIGRLKHTNIVAVHQLAQERGVWYCAMELVHGQPLDRILKTLRKTGRSPSESRLAREAIGVDTAPPTPGRLTGRRAYYARIAEMFAGVAEALQAAHDQEVVHRDVKPANLLLDAEGRLKLVDFGLARLGESAAGATRTGDLVGTPLYMSPEQLAGKRVDHRTDIYSVGATLYEALALRPAFAGPNIQAISVAILRGTLPSPRRFDPHVPKDLETIVQKAMEREPDRRYRTAAEMAEDLWQAARGGAIRARRIGLGGRAWRLARRHRALSALGAATVAATTLGIVAAWRGAVEEGRRRDIEYGTLVASAGALQLERGTESIDDVQDIVIPRSLGGSEVETLYDRAIALRPGRPEAYLGRALDASRAPEARFGDLETARRLGISDRTRLLAEALVDAENGRWRDTTRRLERATTLPRVDAVDFMLEGRILALRGDFKEAEATLTRAVAELPEPTRRFALYARGLARAATGNHEGALEDFVCLDSASNRNTAVLIRIASLWARLGRAERSHAVLERAIALAVEAASEEAWAALLDTVKSCRFADSLDDIWGKVPTPLRDTRRVLIAWSNALRVARRFDDAIEAARRAVSLFPDWAKAYDRLGRALADARRAEEAVPVLERAIALEPQWMTPRANYAHALVQLGRNEDAIRACDDALSLDPTHRHVRANRAVALANSGRVDEALAEFDRQVTERAPGSAWSHATRSRLLRLKGRYDESLAEADRAIALDPLAPAGYLKRGAVLLDWNGGDRLAEALTCFERAVDLAPADGEGHVGLASTLFHLGRLEEAVAAADAGIAAAPRYELLFCEKASTVFALGRFDEALTLCDTVLAFSSNSETQKLATDMRIHALLWLNRLREADRASEEAVERWPDRATAHWARAECLLRADRPEEALAACERSEALDPKCALPYVTGGHALMRLGKLRAALSSYDRATQLNPRDSTAHLGRSLALLGLGQDGALEACDRAIELNPNRPEAHATRGTVLMRGLGRVKEALQAYGRAVELGSEDPLALNCLAWFLATAEDGAQRDPKRAVALARKAVERAPSAGAIWNTLGVALCAAGAWRDALDALEKSLELRSGGDASDWLFVALAKKRLGQEEEARTWFDRAVAWIGEHAPDDKEMARLRVEVGRCFEESRPGTPPESGK